MAWRKYRKVTPELLEYMQQLRNEGMSYSKIAKVVNLATSTVQYHLDSRYKEITNIRARESVRNKNLTEEQKLRKRMYMRNYIRERYHSDPEFRKRMIESAKKYQNENKK